MREERKVPKFATEAEEADWWYENREKHADEFLQAAARGELRVRRLTTGAAAEPKDVHVMLVGEDAKLVRVLAAGKGVTTEAYAADLLHDALHQEFERQASR